MRGRLIYRLVLWVLSVLVLLGHSASPVLAIERPHEFERGCSRPIVRARYAYDGFERSTAPTRAASVDRVAVDRDGFAIPAQVAPRWELDRFGYDGTQLFRVSHHGEATETGTKGGAAGSRPWKDFTPGGKDAVWENGDGTCANCGTPVVRPGQSKPGVKPPGNEGQVDHVEPKSKGGSGDPSNGQILCRTCNGSNGNKFPWP